jgi:hypothetical protein
VHSPSELVEHGVDLGASPRDYLLGPPGAVWALLVRKRTEFYPEDIRTSRSTSSAIDSGSARAASHGLTTDSVIADGKSRGSMNARTPTSNDEL